MMDSIPDRLERARAALQAGDHDTAAQIYRDVLNEQPRQAQALHGLGLIAFQRHNLPLALSLIEGSLGADPALDRGWYHRALILRRMDCASDAWQSVLHAIEAQVANAEAWDLAAQLAHELGDLTHARAAHQQALALRPDDAGLHASYALYLYGVGELAVACGEMQTALALDPQFPPLTLANILKSAGYPARAIPYYERTQHLLPMMQDIKINLAMAHLQIGDFSKGWPLWEQRPDIDARFQTLPLWQGQPVDHLLLYEDQGLGDALQCARFIPRLLAQNRARQITLQVAAPLAVLLQAAFPAVTVVPLESPLPPADARLRLFSLPAHFNLDPADLAGQGAYLPVWEAWRAPWKQRLQSVAGPRIGIVWRGNPGHHNDRLRSMAFSQLAPLVQAANGHLVSLQKLPDASAHELAAAGIVDVTADLTDFTASAGLLAELDLLIAVDTAPLHLAGAIGVPVWGLIAFDADWRWQLGRQDSPWYPHLRLFRQHIPRDWTSVMAEVAAALRVFLNGDRSVLMPPRFDRAPLSENPDAVGLF